ncbi:hypothetical protein GS876_10240 [Rhodococcus hoagii]|nr:hypothetical protein [Prescottella equi]NKT31565.1 hypothetical protein [Prescottella equi]NKT39282.1 hypothetical protein [Prescottella equi]NKU49690.1 hypothetical protein [Prescottella equi]NKU90816.1 hypothetical protein [Prescottella equi]
MAEDPIERLNVDVEVFGIPQSPGQPPMTESFLHIRRRQDGSAERAVMGLPAYQGAPGERGPAGMVHQGTRSLAELEGLANTLSEAELNFTYRRTGTDDLWVWNGKVFRVYENSFGTKGDKGDPPTMQGGTVTVDGVALDSPAGVRVEGATEGGPYTVGIDLPPLPPGPPGPPGPAGRIYTSVDVDSTTAPTDKQILVHDAATGKMVWRDAMLPTEEYVIGPEVFPTATKSTSDTRHVLVSFVVPARPYRYRPDFRGGVDIRHAIGQQIDVEIRMGDSTTGTLVGHGRGDTPPDIIGTGWWHVRVGSYSEISLNPGMLDGTVPPNTEATFTMTAVRRSGSGTWGVRNNYAQLRIRLMRVL